MARHEVKSRERYLARTKSQKLAYAYGIPYHYWADDDSLPVFRSLDFGEGRGIVSSKQQQEWMQNLFVEGTWQRPYLVIIGSEPTDDAAMTLSMRLARAMIAKDVNLVVQNLGVLKPVEDDEETTVYFGHNVTTEMTNTRVQSVRDWVEAHPGTLRVLTVAGNPSDVTLNRLRVDPDAIFFLDDVKRKKTSMV